MRVAPPYEDCEEHVSWMSLVLTRPGHLSAPHSSTFHCKWEQMLNAQKMADCTTLALTLHPQYHDVNTTQENTPKDQDRMSNMQASS